MCKCKCNHLKFSPTELFSNYREQVMVVSKIKQAAYSSDVNVQ